MFNKVENIKDEIILMTLSELVPTNHFLRKVAKAIDFKFIYDLTEEYYSHTSGRNCLDPVVLFKLVFLKDFYGIKSMRETIKRIETDAAFRWFLGIPFSKPVPHYSTFSQNYIRRFQGTDVFEQIFINIVNQAIDKKLVGGTEFFTDSTHIKANANKKKFKVEVTTKIKKRKLVNKTVVLFSGILITIIGINYYAHHQKITEYDTKYSRNFMYFIDLGLTDTGANHSQLPTEILIPEKNGKIQTRTQLESKLNKDIKNRIKNYGILGLIKHQNTKFKYFVQDGTLGWTTEAVLVESNVVKTKFTESTIGHKIRDIIYVHRPYYPKYAIYMQISWIFVVLGLVLYFKKYKKVTYTELVFQLVLLGGILFLSLFEAGRSRYLIQFLPAIILLSSIGYFKMNSSKSS